ncbi:Glycine oxidase ThiO [Arthrobacter sp. PAMC 25486]|uniref:glycine oxidase ThiO n=1 Tax=Arthrobacter sp. PAMC 25486 TaxID=1494608 RepID=UPI0005362113|nr:glycine oxidase ThiO [Arthrobacter sp. PAMC 25486]AIY01421.1 Glycine oxidase ThiO [Arthrobacter sp. PAMC 25486]
MAPSVPLHLSPDKSTTGVAVIGGGIVGLGIAWEAQRAGHTVTVIDPAPATGATFAAAGMLAPVSELHYQEEQLLDLTLAAAARWPDFAASLAGPGVPGTGFRTTPTLVVGADAADRRALAELRDVQRRHGLEVEMLTIKAARAEEPLVGPHISCAFRIVADHQVDPRGTAAAIRTRLVEVAAHRGESDPFIGQGAAGLLWDGRGVEKRRRVTGVVLADGTEIHAREVVVANGLDAPKLHNLPAGLELPLRPVHGDILRLRVPEHLRPLTTATIRGLVRGLPVYIVPREDGTVVIGATSREDHGAGVSAGGVHQLLRDAQVLLPAVAELELLECTARARPGTPDNAPLLGRVAAASGKDIQGLIIATGFFRHGVLLTPIAALIVRQLLGDITDLAWTGFRPDRFSPSLRPALAGPTA